VVRGMPFFQALMSELSDESSCACLFLEWAAALLYSWILIAPLVCQGRDFS
jgi:hypothetical protein